MKKQMLQSQKVLFERIQHIDPKVRMEWDDNRGIATFIRGKLLRVSEQFDSLKSSKTKNFKNFLDKEFKNFLKEYGHLFGPSDLHQKIKLLRSRTDDLGWIHLEYQQIYGDIHEKKIGLLPVYGSKLIAHFMTDGTLIEVQSSCWRDVELITDIQIKQEVLREILTKSIVDLPEFHKLESRMKERKEKNFPMMQPPHLVVYPWLGKFIPAWTTYAFCKFDVPDRSGEPTGEKHIRLGEVFVDGLTGVIFLCRPTRNDQEIPDTGTGLGVTPLIGTHSTRNLNIVRIDTSNTYRLRDTTHVRDIIAYDAAGDPQWSDENEIPAAFMGDTLPVSEDSDGDRNWDHLPLDTTDLERTASQQPEVDAHYFAREAFEWYNALAGPNGRAGWDDGQYSDPPVPPQPIRVLTHAYDDSMGTSRSINAYHDKGLAGGNWYAYLAFFDGDPTATCTNPNDRGMDYMAGAKAVFGHEYQHAITNFSFVDSIGNPGFPYDTFYGLVPEWTSAVHEGLSDVFGCLFGESWFPALEVSHANIAMRNLAFPRDPNTWCNLTGTFPCGLSNHNKDHFDDRNLHNFRYDRGTILGHCAYLMSQGGVHQRANRNPGPVLVPVYSIGRETYSGKDLPKTARIWYRALTNYFQNIGTTTGIPANDENLFRTIRNGCVSSAIDLYGQGSVEHHTTMLAFYAVGLQPVDTPYGADVTFLRWGASWWMSRPYIGINSPDWASVDLFINNGGISEWNALINVVDANGNATNYENNVYCRVRNIGDQAAQAIEVTFQYAKAGTGITNWQDMVDRNGNVQKLTIASLAGGTSNFPDTDQNSPPSTACVKWWIPPQTPGDVVDHYCLKAVVSASNDVNPYNNEVQSNVAYTAYNPGQGVAGFMIGNPTKHPIALNLQVRANLPKGWRATIRETTSGVVLEPGEQRPYRIQIEMPSSADRILEPPFDGLVTGTVFGSLSGPFEGILMGTKCNGEHLLGKISGNIPNVGVLAGKYSGTINAMTGKMKGQIIGSFQCHGRDGTSKICIGIEACLRPLRRIDVAQSVDGIPIGGITFQVQVPTSSGTCSYSLPPVDTQYIPGSEPMPGPTPEPGHIPDLSKMESGKVSRLIFDCHGDFKGFVLSTCSGERIFYTECTMEEILFEACNESWTVYVTPDSMDGTRIHRIDIRC